MTQTALGGNGGRVPPGTRTFELIPFPMSPPPKKRGRFLIPVLLAVFLLLGLVAAADLYWR